METLKEIADRVGVSKTAIRRKIATLDLTSQTIKNEKGVVLVPESVAEIIVSAFGEFQKRPEVDKEPPKAPEQTETQHQNTDLERLIDSLYQRIEAQERIISGLTANVTALTDTVSQLSGALERAQQLHAGTIAERLEAGTAPDQTQTTAPEIVDVAPMQEAPAEPEPADSLEVSEPAPETTPENVPSRAETPKQDDTPAAKRGGILRAIFRRRG